jgi:hypothetical protein
VVPEEFSGKTGQSGYPYGPDFPVIQFLYAFSKYFHENIRNRGAGLWGSGPLGCEKYNRFCNVLMCTFVRRSCMMLTLCLLIMKPHFD